MGDKNTGSNVTELIRPPRRVSTLDTREARQLADLHGVLDDLIRVVARCTMLMSDNLSAEAREALWESIVITYYRCFTSGRTGSESGWKIERGHLALLTDSDRATHERLAKERSRRVANRTVRTFDVLTGFEDIDQDGLPITGIAVVRRAAPFMDPAAPEELAAALIELLEPIYRLEHSKLLKALQQSRPA